MLPPPLKLPPTPAAITRSSAGLCCRFCRRWTPWASTGLSKERSSLRLDNSYDHDAGGQVCSDGRLQITIILIGLLTGKALLRHQMMLSCFLSIRSNDGDLNNQVAAILHLGNISFVEAGNEVVIAVLILGTVLCRHCSRSLISYILGDFTKETIFYRASLIIALLGMIADLYISQFLVMSYNPSNVDVMSYDPCHVI